MRDILLSKIKTKIDNIKKLSHENLISHICSSHRALNERQIDLTLIGILDRCYVIY